MNRDQEQITKERARNAVRHVFGQGLVKVLAAIDALDPAPGRSEIEQRIGGAIEYCDQKVGEVTGHSRTMWQADADILRAALKLRPRFGKDRSSLFQPPVEDMKGGTDGKEG